MTEKSDVLNTGANRTNDGRKRHIFCSTVKLLVISLCEKE